MKHPLLYIVLALALAASASAAKPLSISYLSADHVYLNGGRDVGLEIGWKVTVIRDKAVIGKLEVVFIADHSASCTVIEATDSFKAGDLVELPEPTPVDTTAGEPKSPDSASILPPQPEPAITPAYKHSTPRPEMWGSVSIGVIGWRDKDTPDRDYTQSNIRLNLRTRHLMNDRLTLSIRSRGRYDERNRTYRSTADSRVWLNRLYEFSLLYRSTDQRWRFTLGRAPIRSASALGVLDGLVIERDLGSAFAIGAFGGLQPQWQYSEGRASLSRFGITGEFRQRYGDVAWKSSIALLREYHKTEIGRDAVMLQTSANNRDKWQASLLAEIDYNSGWREERSGKSLTLSSIYTNLRYKLSRRISVNAGYGSRATVWLWDYHNLADSLLDERTRRWVRLGTDLSLGSRWAAGGTVGAYFQDAGMRRQLSTTVYGRIQNLWDPRSSLWAHYSISEGQGEDAHTISVRLSQGIRRMDQFSVGFGENLYQVTGAESRSSWWAEGELQTALINRLMLRLRYRHAAGDDLQGKQFETELGYRF